MGSNSFNKTHYLVFFQNVLLKPFLSYGWHELIITIGSQTTLHCLLDDSVANKSGCFYSQVGIYKDKKSRNSGFLAYEKPKQPNK